MEPEGAALPGEGDGGARKPLLGFADTGAALTAGALA